ncbi:SH3 domain-containing protein [Desulfobacterales bacterium HSG17]|nr:SH3 domain-containing protein [Desulfobacterales bacterium HSG17]
MNRMASLLIAVFCVFLLQINHGQGIANAQSKLWVTASGAKLKADKSASSQTVTELALGTKLSVLASEGRWYEVSSKSGQKGWIYRGKVSDVPPASSKGNKNNSAAGLLSSLGGSDISADSADTSRSIRGLSPEATEYANKAGTPKQHRTALDNVLKVQVSNNEIEKFLKNGKIGEYAQ